MSDDPNAEYHARRTETIIEDEGNGVYTLYVGGSPVVKIDWVSGHRQMRWQIYGPCDLDHSIAIMKGFLHLTALLGNENRAVTNPPAVLEKDSSSTEGKRKWQTSKTTRRSKNS